MKRPCVISANSARFLLLIVAALALSSSNATPQQTAAREAPGLAGRASDVAWQISPFDSDFKVLVGDQSAGN